MHTCYYSNTIVMLMHDRILVSNIQYLTQRTAARIAQLVKAEGDVRQARENIRVEVDITQEDRADVDTPR